MHKDQENSRKLVWIEAQNVAGWGCSNCTWVFHPANLPIPNSFRELTSHAQRQLDNEFASHTGAEHPRSEAAGSSGKAQRGVSDGTGREGCSLSADQMLFATLSLTQPVASFFAALRPTRGKAQLPELPTFVSPFLSLPVLRWIANLWF